MEKKKNYNKTIKQNSMSIPEMYGIFQKTQQMDQVQSEFKAYLDKIIEANEQKAIDQNPDLDQEQRQVFTNYGFNQIMNLNLEGYYEIQELVLDKIGKKANEQQVDNIVELIRKTTKN